jgi:hypothetical protein
MPSQSELISLTPKERREYGFARVRDAAFDAVSALWRRRQGEGMTQAGIAEAIGADPGWVSKNLRGPGNWTLKTFGTFVEALDGEAQIIVRAAGDPLPLKSNWHAYADYEIQAVTITDPADLAKLSASKSPSTTRGLPVANLIP